MERLATVRDRAVPLLGHLGFGHVLTNELLTPAFTERLPDPQIVGEGFVLHALPETAPVGVLDRWPTPVPEHRYDREVLEWLLGGGETAIVATSVWKPPEAPVPEARIKDWRTSPSEDHWAFEVTGDTPAPVLIKTSYFPNWRAYDGTGHRLPLFRAAPYLMATIAHGEVELRYEPTLEQRIASAISLAAVVVVLLALLRRRLRGQRRRRALWIIGAGFVLAAAIAGASSGLVRPVAPFDAASVTTGPGGLPEPVDRTTSTP